MDLLPNSVESLQSDSKILNLEDYYETSDNYETTDNEYSRPVVSSKQTLKKKQIRGMNSETQAELANHPDVLKILNLLRYPCSGLHEEKHLTYIERVGGFTIFGKAPPIKEIAQELFPKKFTKKTKFSYNKLT
ncbi:29127_t:CDS:2 [Racocetra persica]|uniref:29127_t:CDS:1 n=1 Tax=Racocetra persica TaxID=160502 RepID=A0ACA9M4H3_9GLOM|nr:29127_t:CDS:2 [Racocetra persica]